MTFKFIHTADWQIGAPFASFGADLAARLTDARLGMISTIGRLASDNDVANVFVAGDVWDSEQPSDKTVRQPLDLMAGFGNVVWWLMPGNHDPYRHNMLWSRIAERAPKNVRLLLEPTPEEVAPTVWLLPAPWTSKSHGRDLTEWMDSAQLPEDAIKIGIGHGSIFDFSSSDSEGGDPGINSTIDPKRADLAQLDYLALGDWHGVLKITDRIWYSGTPETDRFRRNNPGHVLLVTVAKGVKPTVEQIKTSTFDWEILDIACLPDVGEFSDIDRLEDLGSLRNVLLQINFTGQMNQKNWLAVEARLRALQERTAFLDVRTDQLTQLVLAEDLDELDHGGSVRMAAERLLEIKESAGTPGDTKKVAADALRLLLSYAKEEAKA
ncbi:MAG: metallophosphoesterase [Aestuariivita sp.]|nr:metallophosphoesterase [Aestuariivita sp.]MCY4346748.1 metallophosphoesterase [Aestuariivita sp.]